MIVVQNARKSFPIAYGIIPTIKYLGKIPRTEVLHGISLTVRRGELFGLLGPNGAGKTTLLKMLCTLTTPDSGSITVNGINAVKHSVAIRREIGLCGSEDRSFYFRLTARQNLEFFGALAGLHGNTLASRIEEVVDFVDLGHAIDKRVSGFSSGMRQRLMMARAILPDPPILLLDEPTRAVDPVHAEELRRIIREELVDRRGKTVVLATNMLEEAWQLCDRVAIMRKGNVAALGPPNELNANYARVLKYHITVDHTEDALLARTKAIPGLTIVDMTAGPDGVTIAVEIEPSESSVTELLRAVSSNAVTVRSIRQEEPRPLEVFVDITQGPTEDE